MTAITNVLSILFFKNRLNQRHHLHCVGEKTPPGRLTGPCGSRYSIQKWILSCFWTVPSLQISLRMLLLKAIGFKVYKSLCVYLLACEPDLWLMALMPSKLSAQHPCISGPQPIDSLMLWVPASLDLSLLTVFCCVSLHHWTSACWQSALCCRSLHLWTSACGQSHVANPVRLQSTEGSRSHSQSFSPCLSVLCFLSPSLPLLFSFFGLYNVSKDKKYPNP